MHQILHRGIKIDRAHAQSSGRIFQTVKKKEEKIQITIKNLHAFHKKTS